jgi:hypothetical protein
VQAGKDEEVHTLSGQVLHLEALVGAVLHANDRSVRNQRIVDTRVGHQVGLELVQVDVESTLEAQAGGNGADNLGNETVQVLIAGTGDIQVTTADVVDSLVVNEESTVGVLNGAVGGQDGVVGLNNGSRHLGRRVHRELQLGLLAILAGKALKQESTKSGTGTTTEGVEDEESLQRRAVV